MRGVALRGIVAGFVLLSLVAPGRAQDPEHDWPEWRGRGRRGVWTKTGILDTFPDNGLKAAWRTPIRSGYAGAAVADGRVFVTDAQFPDPKRTRAMERALALDERTGEILWTHEWETNYAGLQLVYAIGPRATPTVDGNRVFVLGAMGNLFALEVRDGHVLWQKDYVRDFNTTVPSWGMSGAPLVHGDRLIALVGGEPNAKFMAFDKVTGEAFWRALSSDWEPGYSQPVIVEAAGTAQLIAWHPRAISSLDPVTGAVYWEVPHIVDMGINPATAVRSGPHLFVTSQYGGALTLRLNDDTRPGATLRHATAFFVRHGDRYFINTDNGDLVIAQLSAEGYSEISRTRLIAPTHPYVRRRAHGTVVNWSHPAYANRHIVARNDEEIVRLSLAAEQ